MPAAASMALTSSAKLVMGFHGNCNKGTQQKDAKYSYLPNIRRGPNKQRG